VGVRNGKGKEKGNGRGRWTHVEILTCEDDYFVELGDVRDEIIYPWSFSRPPTMFTLKPISMSTSFLGGK